jgi:EAL domain-containing protein (putative c-di-GMP-specific phosphodiesterase class I)
VLRYQPYADLRTGECTGVEAVPYWRHPTLGLLPPREFLPLAERTGQSVALGTYVLRAACRQLAAWDGIPGTAVPRIGVDTSARQLLDPAFAATVARTLAEAGLAADRLVLEIVESEHLDDEVARDELQRITATGVRIALDDFGTGYVSFGALRSFPIAQIKLHPSFVGEPRGGETLQLVISVGRVLGAEPVVQGISSAEQAAGLPAGAAGQGPFVAPVMAPNEVPEWLALHVR